jgi:hypothetical protein
MYPGGQPAMPYPPPPAPGRPARPAARVAAGLLWAFAAALAVGAQFGDIYRSRVTWSMGDDERIVGFWQSHSILNGEEKLSSPAFGGVSVLVAVAVLAVASLLVFVTRRRWGAVIVGTLGAGMMLDEVVSYVTVGAVQTELSLGPGHRTRHPLRALRRRGFRPPLPPASGETSPGTRWRQ